MKPLFNRQKILLSVWLPVLMAFLSGSCSQDVPEVVEEEDTYTLRLQITTGGIFSRAGEDWENDGSEYWVDGSAFDQTISSLDLFLLSDDNGLTPLYGLKEPGSDAHIYVCDLRKGGAPLPGVTIDAANRTATFSGRIMAVANVDAKGNPIFNLADWATSKIPFDVRFGQSENWHIPMWGVETYSNITVEANKIKALKDIEMIRAVSKIVIKLDDSIKDRYHISGVKMADDSQLLKGAGYNLPDRALSITSTKNLTRSECLGLRTDASEKESLEFRFNSDKDECFTYVSESRTADPSKPFAFDVTLKEGETGPEFTGTVYLAYYSYLDPSKYDEGKVITDVVRNHTYQFTLKLKELTFVPDVKEWVFGGKVHIDLE